MERPLFGLVEILSEAGVSLKEPGTVDHVVISARNFRMPPNLGPVLADTLYVIRLRRSSFSPFCRPLSNGVAGEMWRWETLLERGEPAVPVFAARSGNVVLVATKLELVRDAMSSITRGVDVTGARSLTACLKGYPRLWGARLYGTRRYRDKLSSGLWLDGYEVEQDAKYTLFELGSGTSLSIRYYCSSGNAGPLRYFGQSGKSVKEIQPGIWETNLELGDPQSDEGFVLCVLGLFGFGIYV